MHPIKEEQMFMNQSTSHIFAPNQEQYGNINPKLSDNTGVTRMFSTSDEEIENFNQENPGKL